jgi:hypothetical protein
MRWLLPRIGKPCPPAKTIVRSLTPFQCLSLSKIRFNNNGDEVRRGKRAHGLRITASGHNHCKYELAINLKTAKVTSFQERERYATAFIGIARRSPGGQAPGG